MCNFCILTYNKGKLIILLFYFPQFAQNMIFLFYRLIWHDIIVLINGKSLSKRGCEKKESEWEGTM